MIESAMANASGCNGASGTPSSSNGTSRRCAIAGSPRYPRPSEQIEHSHDRPSRPRRLRRLAPTNWLTFRFLELAQFSVPVDGPRGTERPEKAHGRLWADLASSDVTCRTAILQAFR